MPCALPLRPPRGHVVANADKLAAPRRGVRVVLGGNAGDATHAAYLALGCSTRRARPFFLSRTRAGQNTRSCSKDPRARAPSASSRRAVHSQSKYLVGAAWGRPAAAGGARASISTQSVGEWFQQARGW